MGYFDSAFKLISLCDPGHSDLVPKSTTDDLVVYDYEIWIWLIYDQIFVLYYTEDFI